jgi:hypothetical protein
VTILQHAGYEVHETRDLWGFTRYVVPGFDGGVYSSPLQARAAIDRHLQELERIAEIMPPRPRGSF